MRLALFPLAVVLLPGTAMPLHIFEIRYRKMIADALAGSREFGIMYLPPGVRETDLSGGWPICVARIEEHEPLPDGRSNIVVRGGQRVILRTLLFDETPYPVAIVQEAPDVPVPAEALAPLAAEARDLYTRAITAARTIADDATPPPPLPDDPALLAYAIAATIDLDLPARQRLLDMRDPSERLAQIIAMLAPGMPDLERRAATHRRASTNGHGPH